MSNLAKSSEEIEPAPIPESTVQEYPDCIYFCFYIDPKIYDKENFKISSSFISSLSIKDFKLDNNLVVFCIYLEGILNYAFKLFKSTYYFKISYKYKNNSVFLCDFDFTVEKNKIKFFYDSGKKGTIKNELFKNPSCLEQYNAFCSISKKHDIIFKETVNFLSDNLDMELFLNLLQDKKEEREELMSILDNFPYFKINYDKNRPLPKIDFDPFSGDRNYRKLLLIYSAIQDTIVVLDDFNEDDISNFIDYNETQKDKPILLKNNLFTFFIEKTNELDYIKKICHSVDSIPLLFDCLIGLKEEQFNKIKNLKFEDLPNQYSIKDDLIELIDKYEKVKEAFCKSEIDKVWKKYLKIWYDRKTISQLEEVIDKFNSINSKDFANIINDIKNDIINKGKKSIKGKNLKSLDMYKFINKYNDIGDFLSDETILGLIGENVVLDELNSEEILKEFNQCKFLSKIKPKFIHHYINGTLTQVNTFEKFYLYFKYIYLLKAKENEEKNKICVKLILSHFVYL